MHVHNSSKGLKWEEVDKALQKATREYKLCPNRVWAAVESHPLDGKVLPYLVQRRVDEPLKGHGHENHDHCTLESCKWSQRDWTKIPQRHEPQYCAGHSCERQRYQFSMHPVEEATKAGKLAAWKLDGKSLIDTRQPYMAISHVQADGTGNGTSKGQVNPCLYNYFRSIAAHFRCEGIWWDTISVSKNKHLNGIAMNQTPANYGAAWITLVHDCYLREWDWFDAETACFAIIMSPWFACAWTAVHLAHSRKVKIIFKNAVIKDLDDDILVKPRSMRHQIAFDLITNLRRGPVTTIDNLLRIVKPRCTAVYQDRLLITALLTGFQVQANMDEPETYKNVLLKIGKLSHDNLFHKAPNMPTSFTWSPADLLDMPISTKKPVLQILPNGDIYGPWKIIHNLQKIHPKMYEWTDVHPLVAAKLRTALHDPGHLMLLAEPTPPEDPRAHRASPITKALLVTPIGPEAFYTLGSVFFDPPLTAYDQMVNSTNLTILSHAGGTRKISHTASSSHSSRGHGY